jgi:hypothetical protein
VGAPRPPPPPPRPRPLPPPPPPPPQVTYGPLDADGWPAEACIDGPREIDLALPSYIKITSLTLVPS